MFTSEIPYLEKLRLPRRGIYTIVRHITADCDKKKLAKQYISLDSLG
jgi:hypothetical protein